MRALPCLLLCAPHWNSFVCSMFTPAREYLHKEFILPGSPCLLPFPLALIKTPVHPANLCPRTGPSGRSLLTFLTSSDPYSAPSGQGPPPCSTGHSDCAPVLVWLLNKLCSYSGLWVPWGQGPFLLGLPLYPCLEHIAQLRVSIPRLLVGWLREQWAAAWTL